MILPSEWVGLFPEAGRCDLDCQILDCQIKDQLPIDRLVGQCDYCSTKDFFQHN
jgi:hypothetical protein